MKTTRLSCQVCGRRPQSVKEYSLEMYCNGTSEHSGELFVQLQACDECWERVADELANVVINAKAAHVAEIHGLP